MFRRTSPRVFARWWFGVRRRRAGGSEYVAVEKDDGSNFAFEYGVMAMLHYSRVRVDTAVVRHGSVLDCRDGRAKMLNASDQPMSRAKIEDCFVSKNPRPRPPPLACATSRRGEGSYPHELVAMCGMPVATSDACLADAASRIASFKSG